MKNLTKLAGLVGVLALTASSALALPTQPPSNAGTAHAPSSAGTGQPPSSPGPNASAQSKAKAYGKACANESKTHVAGTPGTAFSKCVTALAKVAHNHANPTTACNTLSKKHVAGTPGTPFSKCVSDAAKVQSAQSDSTDSTDTTATS
jgi:hypothetical protein